MGDVAGGGGLKTMSREACLMHIILEQDFTLIVASHSMFICAPHVLSSDVTSDKCRRDGKKEARDVHAV